MSLEPYKIGQHRHTPEIEQELGGLLQRLSQSSGTTATQPIVTFTPHLVPMNRGILATIYVRGLKTTPQDLHAVLAKAYAPEPFVHVLPFGATPQTRHVRGSNMTFIG